MLTHEEMLALLKVHMASNSNKDKPAEPDGEEEGTVVCCNRVHDEATDDPVQGATIHTCCDCGHRIWASPSTIRLIAEKQGRLKCVLCVLANDAHKPDFKISPVRPSQALELAMETDITKDELEGLQDDKSFHAAVFKLFGRGYRPRHDD